MTNYHPVSSVYPINFNGSDFEKQKMNEFNRLNEDACYNELKDFGNEKQIKFYTTNFADLLNAQKEKNFFGMTMKEGVFVPGDKIDTYSSLLNGELTNCNVKHTFGQLPIPTTPYQGQLQHGDIYTEDTFRNNVEPKKNSCLAKDTKYYNRSFSIFDSPLIEEPMAMNSVETLQKGFNMGRQGMSTRFQKSNS